MRAFIVEFCLSIYKFLLPFCWIALAAIVAVLLPLSAWNRTRAWASSGMLISSFLFGITTWLLGAAASFASFGWLGLIIGLVFVGVGVVPLGILGAFWKLDVSDLGWSLILMLIITFATRVISIKVMEKADT